MPNCKPKRGCKRSDYVHRGRWVGESMNEPILSSVQDGEDVDELMAVAEAQMEVSCQAIYRHVTSISC